MKKPAKRPKAKKATHKKKAAVRRTAAGGKAAVKKRTATKAARAEVARAPVETQTTPLTSVQMAIDFGAAAPSDIMSVMRIDGKVLPSGQADVTAGSHTAGWDVVSPTVRPIAFGVTIVRVTTGVKLLDRSKERTGPDGKGAGADRFSV
jgi:hypothetical protein